MKKKTRLLSLALSAVMGLGVLTGCGAGSASASASASAADAASGDFKIAEKQIWRYGRWLIFPGK